MKIALGRPIATYTSTSPSRVSISPSASSWMNSGITASFSGTINPLRKNRNTSPDPRNGYRAMA